MGCAPQRDVSSDRGLGRCFGNSSRKPQARSVQIAREKPLAWLVKLHGDWQADSPCVVPRVELSAEFVGGLRATRKFPSAENSGKMAESRPEPADLACVEPE
jgi:hypothetical protein